MGEAEAAAKGGRWSSEASLPAVDPPTASEAEQQQASNYPKEGDTVILYGSRDNIIPCVLQPPGICRTRLGNFAHGDIIKTRIGHKVRDRRNGKWLVVLRPTPDLHTLALCHRTQIIYHADISLILSLLDVAPGKTIIESGTGSGSLSFSLAATLRPEGRLYTFEFHEQRWQEAKVEFKLLGISSEIRSFHRDVCAQGFCQQPPTAATTEAPAAAAGRSEKDEGLPAPHSADGVFLDLPSPWLALKHADHVLKGGGRLVTFSPCVEQLHKTLAAARELGFQGGAYEGTQGALQAANPTGLVFHEENPLGAPQLLTKASRSGASAPSSRGYFQAFEVLAKPWGVCISRPHPEQQQPQREKRKRSTSPQPHHELKNEEESQEAQEPDKPLNGSFPALLSHFMHQPLPSFLNKDTTPAGPAPSTTAPAEVSLEGLARISSYHYQLPMKGHTGYVTVCFRPNEDEALQPLP